MKYEKIFNSGFKITQYFGANKDYYSKFGLLGHEGIDLIPKDGDLRIYSPVSGKVIDDNDIEALNTVYGICVRIYNEETRQYVVFAHLKENFVDLNQEIRKGDLIGKMGNTGNSHGAHLHLGYAIMEPYGSKRLHKENGYLGYIDPMNLLRC